MRSPMLDHVNQLENEELADQRRQERNDCWAAFGKIAALLVALVIIQALIWS